VPLVKDTGANLVWPGAWSPDGKTLAFDSGRPNSDIWTLPLDDGENPGEPEVFLETDFAERDPDFSPDGRWLAYTSNQSGRWEVYVRPYPKGEGQWMVSTDGGRYPQWSRDSRELFYLDGGRMMVVDYAADGDAFVHGRPELLFEVPVEPSAYYDVTADGQRFFVLLREESEEGEAETQRSHLSLVTHWFEEVERLVPIIE